MIFVGILLKLYLVILMSYNYGYNQLPSGMILQQLSFHMRVISMMLNVLSIDISGEHVPPLLQSHSHLSGCMLHTAATAGLRLPCRSPWRVCNPSHHPLYMCDSSSGCSGEIPAFRFVWKTLQKCMTPTGWGSNYPSPHLANEKGANLAILHM